MKALQSALLILGLSFFSQTSHSQDNSFLTNGLIAYYQFNGNVNDSSGQGHNGTVNNVAFVPDRFGNPNAAASFTGNSTSFVQVNTADFNFSSNFTVSVWINPSGVGTGGPRVFSTAGYEIAINLPETNSVNFSTSGGLIENIGTPPSGVWIHIAAVSSETNLFLYLNGSLSASVTTTGPPDYSRGFIPKIGGNSGISSPDNYGGLMDDFRIFNRALSAQEVSTLFAAESFTARVITLPAVTITTDGTLGKTYGIQYVNDPTATNWTTLATNITFQGNAFLFPDTNAVGQPKRFYRVSSQ